MLASDKELGWCRPPRKKWWQTNSFGMSFHIGLISIFSLSSLFFHLYFSTRRACPRVLKFCICSQFTKILGFHRKNHLKLLIYILGGWGKCLIVILQTHATKNSYGVNGVWAGCRICADTGATTPTGASVNLHVQFQVWCHVVSLCLLLHWILA